MPEFWDFNFKGFRWLYPSNIDTSFWAGSTFCIPLPLAGTSWLWHLQHLVVSKTTQTFLHKMISQGLCIETSWHTLTGFGGSLKLQWMVLETLHSYILDASKDSAVWKTLSRSAAPWDGPWPPGTTLTSTFFFFFLSYYNCLYKQKTSYVCFLFLKLEA